MAPPARSKKAASSAQKARSPKTKAVRGSRSGRPVMVLLDLLGRRWVLRVLWELRAGPLTFRALREACDDISPSTLNQRLADLREADLVMIEDGTGYRLSPLGEELGEHMLPLNRWADAWARRRAEQRVP